MATNGGGCESNKIILAAKIIIFHFRRHV